MKRKRKGFTLIEVTLAILLISILIGITTPLVSNVVSRADLNAAHESLYNSILRAQNLSKIQYRNQQWRVCIDNTAKQYIIAAGTCSSPLYAETIKFSSNITVSSTQTLDLQFTSPKGELNYAGNFSKISLNGGGVSKSIIVNKNGVIDKAATSDPSNTTFTPSIVTDGLVLHLDSGNIGSYPGSGNTWFDLSGNNNGTLLNGVGYTSANGGSLIFDGVDDYANIGTPSINIGKITVNAWVKINAGSLYQHIVDSASNAWHLAILTDNRPYFWNGATYHQSAPAINVGQWYMITGVQGSTLDIYLNGVLGQSVASNINVTTNNIILGRWQNGTRSLNGNISQVSIYNRALTPAEIQQNFNATKGRFGL